MIKARSCFHGSNSSLPMKTFTKKYQINNSVISESDVLHYLDHRFGDGWPESGHATRSTSLILLASAAPAADWQTLEPAHTGAEPAEYTTLASLALL
ncbi:hypothetical protein VCHA40O237_40016 [Vibrio chagasii]|nr:hypothetical protein VCHA40O237_40016 [Vibrio chagasii]